MAYSTEKDYENRWFDITLRAPVLVLTFAAGPVLWSWLLRRDSVHGTGNHQFLKFLTASYNPENQNWEANRIAKSMLLRCAVAVAPVSYFPGLQLSLVLSLTFAFTAWHLRNYPYKFNLLNIVVAAYGLLVIVFLMLASLFVWAKFILHDEHELFKTVRAASS